MKTELFKSCISHFPTGVAVVAVIFDGKKYGMTINSLCSVSLKPPMVLYCIDKGAERFRPFFEAEKFILNILNDEQKHISSAFAKNNRDLWEEFLQDDLKIEGANCYIECKTHHRYDGGDHKIIVALVEKCAQNSSIHKNPLIYYRSSYQSI